MMACICSRVLCRFSFIILRLSCRYGFVHGDIRIPVSIVVNIDVGDLCYLDLIEICLGVFCCGMWLGFVVENF